MAHFHPLDFKLSFALHWWFKIYRKSMYFDVDSSLQKKLPKNNESYFLAIKSEKDDMYNVIRLCSSYIVRGFVWGKELILFVIIMSIFSEKFTSEFVCFLRQTFIHVYCLLPVFSWNIALSKALFSDTRLFEGPLWN